MPELGEKVEAEIENVEQVLGDLPTARRLRELSSLELAGTAALLSSIYNGIENILKQILIDRGVALPTGESWHRDLLVRAVDKQILATRTHEELAPYLAFRHFFAHAYGFDIDPERLEPLVKDLGQVWTKVANETRAAVENPGPD